MCLVADDLPTAVLTAGVQCLVHLKHLSVEIQSVGIDPLPGMLEVCWCVQTIANCCTAGHAKHHPLWLINGCM